MTDGSREQLVRPTTTAAIETEPEGIEYVSVEALIFVILCSSWEPSSSGCIGDNITRAVSPIRIGPGLTRPIV
jgi:hypothetical protein